MGSQVGCNSSVYRPAISEEKVKTSSRGKRIAMAILIQAAGLAAVAGIVGAVAAFHF